MFRLQTVGACFLMSILLVIGRSSLAVSRSFDPSLASKLSQFQTWRSDFIESQPELTARVRRLELRAQLQGVISTAGACALGLSAGLVAWVLSAHAAPVEGWQRLHLFYKAAFAAILGFSVYRIQALSARNRRAILRQENDDLMPFLTYLEQLDLLIDSARAFLWNKGESHDFRPLQKEVYRLTGRLFPLRSLRVRFRQWLELLDDPNMLRGTRNEPIMAFAEWLTRESLPMPSQPWSVAHL